MKQLSKLGKYFSQAVKIDEIYADLIIETVIVLVVALLLKKLFARILNFNNNKKNYVINKQIQILITIVEWLLLLFIWDNYIKSLMTLISFISAAITISLRDIIFNFFCGIFIKIRKPFEVEDRIEIQDLKGDVVSINSLSFELLELKSDDIGGQSTGIIINYPNSTIFKNPVKNYTKLFKYIWDEITVRVPLDCDLPKIKSELYKIVNNNEVIKSIPNKMKNQLHHANNNYRIYYNKFEPIIYTRVVENHIELQIRYLMHPKKSRYISSVIWNQIIEAYKNNKIDLYKE